MGKRITSGTHNYDIFNSGLGSGVKVIDMATPRIGLLARQFPNETKKALKSAGWWYSGEIKTGIKSGAPGGQKYQDFSGITNKRDILARKKVPGKIGKRGKPLKKYMRSQKQNRLAYEDRRHKPLGKLAAAVGYKYYADSSRVVVGPLSQSAMTLFQKMEPGFNIQVTGKMRRLYRGSQIPLGKKTTIRVPARPTFGPMYRAKSSQVGPYMERKILSYIGAVQEGRKGA